MKWISEFRFKICFICIFQEAEEEKVLSVRDLPGKKSYAWEFVENTLTS